MKNENALAIGVSSLEFFNILLTYYPKGINETFDIYLFVDDKRVSVTEVKNIIKEHNIPVFNNATVNTVVNLYDYYAEKHGYEGKAKQMMYNQGCVFKILMPIYLQEHYGVKRTYTSDDDIFIFNDLSYMFDEYKEFGFKKENLFNLRNSDKYEVLAAFNEIFETDFTLEEVNALSVNAGNVIYGYDPDMEKYVKRWMNHPMVHHLFYDFDGYTSWTIEQRFQHFNLHRLKREGRTVDILKSKDLRLMQNLDKGMKAGKPDEKYLKQVTPSLIHYAIGTKKPLWLRDFLPGISWKFNGFQYQPKYELKDILYNKEWTPPKWQEVQKKIKNGAIKKTSVF